MLDSLISFSNIVKTPFELHGQGGEAFWRPPPGEMPQAAVLHGYMRTLAFIGDWDEMMWLLEWMAGVGNAEMTELYGAWDETDVLDRERGWGMAHAKHTRHALCAFRAFAEPALLHRKAEVQGLVARVREKKCGSPQQEGQTRWSWPSDQDVHAYLQGDTRGPMGKTLRRVIMASRQRPDPWVSKLGRQQAAVKVGMRDTAKVEKLGRDEGADKTENISPSAAVKATPTLKAAGATTQEAAQDGNKKPLAPARPSIMSLWRRFGWGSGDDNG
jgi:hypothetical protein